jgi:hypothetical protein
LVSENIDILQQQRKRAMEQIVPTILLRIDPAEGSVLYDMASAGRPDDKESRHEEAVDWGVDRRRGGPPVTAPYMLAANGAIVELGDVGGRFRHEVFIPEGKLEGLLLASKTFPVVRLVARMVVLEKRPRMGSYFVDPDAVWTTQGSQ